MMSRPLLYEQKFIRAKEMEQGDEKVYPLLSAHQLAKYWRVSIRTARRKINKLSKDGKLKQWTGKHDANP